MNGTIACPVCQFARPVIFPWDVDLTADDPIPWDAPEWRDWIMAKQDEIAEECEYVETQYHKFSDQKLFDMIAGRNA